MANTRRPTSKEDESPKGIVDSFLSGGTVHFEDSQIAVGINTDHSRRQNRSVPQCGAYVLESFYDVIVC